MVFGVQTDFFMVTFSLIYLVSAVIFCWILVLSKKLRKTPALLPFQIILFLFLIWCVDYSFFSFTGILEIWILLEQIAYVGYTWIPVFLFILAWHYTGHKDFFRCGWAPFICIVPFVTLIIAWIPGYQDLLMSGFYIDASGFIPVLKYEYGIWAYAFTANTTVCLAGSCILLINAFFTQTNTQKKGLLCLLSGVIIFSLWNLFYITGIIPVWTYYLPFPTLLVSILFAIAIFWYNALDFLPLARTIVLEQISDLFLILSVDNHIVDINPSMARAFNLEPASSLGRMISEVFSLWPDFVMMCMSSGLEQVFSLRKDETIHVYSMRKSAITDKEGEILGTVLILHDISELESARVMLEQSNEELQSANKKLKKEISERVKAESALHLANEKLNLLSTITRHDILNVVTALRGYLDFSLEEISSETTRSYLKNCLDLTDMIESQIKFTRVYDDIGTNAPTWQYLPDLINKVRTDIHTENMHYHINLDDVMVHADPLLVKVFFTLVENTLRHGMKATDVRFSTILNSGQLIIVYEDNGTGIKMEEKERIFTRHFGKNTGLGLFVTREILAITGLTIKETGEEGKGVKFEIEVPDGSWRMRSE